MFKLLKVQRSLVYYHLNTEHSTPYNVSRRRISRIMKENGLVSNYAVAQYKVNTTNFNASPIPNLVDREFDNRDKLEVAVIDLTYVRVADKWNYVCTLRSLYNREIISN